MTKMDTAVIYDWVHWDPPHPYQVRTWRCFSFRMCLKKGQKEPAVISEVEDVFARPVGWHRTAIFLRIIPL